MTEGTHQPPKRSGFQRWVEVNRAKIWIWGIAALALGGVGCMFLVGILLILDR